MRDQSMHRENRVGLLENHQIQNIYITQFHHQVHE